MENIINLISDYQSIILIVLLALIVLLFFIIMVQFSAINKLEKRYRRFMRGADGKNIEEMISSYMDRIDDASEKTDNLNVSVKEIDSKLNSCIQKFSIMRYRAFEDVGSDLSYSI